MQKIIKQPALAVNGSGTAQKTSFALLEEDKAVLSLKERAFRFLVREGQIRFDEDKLVDFLGQDYPRFHKGTPDIKSARAKAREKVSLLALEGKWPELEQIRDSGCLKAYISKEFVIRQDVQEILKEFYRDLANITGNPKPTLEQWDSCWLGKVPKIYGNTNETAVALGGLEGREAERYSKTMYATFEKRVRMGERMADAIRRQEGLTVAETDALAAYESGACLDGKQLKLVRAIYKPAKAYTVDDFGKTGHDTLLHNYFGHSVYKAVSALFLPGQELFHTAPKFEAFVEEISLRRQRGYTSLPETILPRDVKGLKKEYGVARISEGLTIISRKGRWEAHRDIMPWDMEVSPRYLFKNHELKGKEVPEWFAKQKAEVVAKANKLCEGQYMFVDGDRLGDFYVERKDGKLSVWTEKRNLIVAFIKLKQEETGMNDPRELCAQMFGSAKGLYAEFGVLYLLAKLVEPTLMPHEMKMLPCYPPEKILEKALKMYGERWYKWFEWKHPNVNSWLCKPGIGMDEAKEGMRARREWEAREREDEKKQRLLTLDKEWGRKSDNWKAANAFIAQRYPKSNILSPPASQKDDDGAATGIKQPVPSQVDALPPANKRGMQTPKKDTPTLGGKKHKQRQAPLAKRPPKKMKENGGFLLDPHDHRMLADMDRAFGGGRATSIFSLPSETSKRPFNLDSIGDRARARNEESDERKWSPKNALPLQEEILAEKHDGERWRRETRDCMRYCREILVPVSGKANIRLTVTHNSTCFPWSVANGNGSPLLKIDIQYDEGRGTYSYGENAGSFSIRELDAQMLKIASLLASQQTSN